MFGSFISLAMVVIHCVVEPAPSLIDSCFAMDKNPLFAYILTSSIFFIHQYNRIFAGFFGDFRELFFTSDRIMKNIGNCMLISIFQNPRFDRTTILKFKNYKKHEAKSSMLIISRSNKISRGFRYCDFLCFLFGYRNR